MEFKFHYQQPQIHCHFHTSPHILELCLSCTVISTFTFTSSFTHIFFTMVFFPSTSIYFQWCPSPCFYQPWKISGIPCICISYHILMALWSSCITDKSLILTGMVFSSVELTLRISVFIYLFFSSQFFLPFLCFQFVYKFTCGKNCFAFYGIIVKLYWLLFFCRFWFK